MILIKYYQYLHPWKFKTPVYYYINFIYMPKHKSEDYKISAVQYYIENGTSFEKTIKEPSYGWETS